MDKAAFENLQKAMPWTSIWSEDFRRDPRSYAKFQHCLMNIAAKLGAIMQRVEMSDHYGAEYELGLNRQKDAKALAFIIMSAMKAANSYPGSQINLADYIATDLERRKSENE